MLLQEEQKKIMEEWELGELPDKEAPEHDPPRPHAVMEQDICL